jgi:hypothetical protein
LASGLGEFATSAAAPSLPEPPAGLHPTNKQELTPATKVGTSMHRRRIRA